MIEWYDNQKQSSSNFRKLLQERIQKSNPRRKLTAEEQTLLTSTLRASNHPLSRSLYNFLQTNNIHTLDAYKEDIGQGISGVINQNKIKVGSYEFVANGEPKFNQATPNQTTVHISTNDTYKGYYIFDNKYREGMQKVFQSLAKDCKLVVLSGDNEGEKKHLKKILLSWLLRALEA